LKMDIISQVVENRGDKLIMEEGTWSMNHK
jgi:hypothetical protein